MKNVLVFALLLIGLQVFASDVLVLQNGKAFEGKVIKIKKSGIVFQAGDYDYQVPAGDISKLRIENISKRAQRKIDRLNFDDNCMKGKSDAQMYHGKTGLHVALGVLFGPFAVIGAAIANPTPQSGKTTVSMSQNKELFSDPEYLQCYKKTAKGQNVLHSSLGWAAWVILVLAI